MRLVDVSLLIALSVPQHRASHDKAYVPWRLIEALRESLREEGAVSDKFVDWVEDGKVRRARGARPAKWPK